MCSRTFFSHKRAAEFAERVNGQVWYATDAFDQCIYIVKWYK